MATKVLMIAAAISLATLAGCVTAASAHDHGHMDHMNHVNHFGHHHPGFIVLGGYNDCGYLFDKWQFTGSWYWKRRFFECKYGG